MNNAIDHENFATHKHIIKVTEGELNFCMDCKGGEVELVEMSCEERQRKNRKDEDRERHRDIEHERERDYKEGFSL